MERSTIHCIERKNPPPPPPQKPATEEKRAPWRPEERWWKKALLGLAGITFLFAPGVYTHFRISPFDRKE